MKKIPALAGSDEFLARNSQVGFIVTASRKTLAVKKQIPNIKSGKKRFAGRSEPGRYNFILLIKNALSTFYYNKET